MGVQVSRVPSIEKPARRVAIVASHLPRGDNGGAERQALRAGHELAARGHRVTLFVRGESAGRHTDTDIEVIERSELRNTRSALADMPAARFIWDLAQGIIGVRRSCRPFDAVLSYHTYDAGFV